MSNNSVARPPHSRKSATRQRSKIEVGDQHLSNFEHYRLKGDLGQAFAELSLALCILPTCKDTYYSSYLEVFESWSVVVEEKYGFKECMALFEVALKNFPDSNDIKHLLAKALYRHGSLYEAWSYACLASKGCPEDPSAQETCNHLTNALVDRWHFPMLNDIKRNTAFKKAIEKAVEQGHDVVLDIGSGTGLLSIFAKWAGAKEVYGCEVNKFMCEMANGVLEANEITRGIQIFNLHSQDLVVSSHIPERPSLIVSETVDAGLFGEHILSTLQHAWAHLLLPPVESMIAPDVTNVNSNLMSNEETRHGVDKNVGNEPEDPSEKRIPISSKVCGKVIPSKAQVFVALINCNYIANCTKLQNCNLSLFQNKMVLLKLNEPYLSEKLSQVPGGYRLLSHWRPITEINFNSPEDIERHLNGAINKTHEIKCTSEGIPDALVIAFNLYTDDSHFISTLPEECSAAWENAIFPVTSLEKVSPGDDIKINFTCHGVINLAVLSKSSVQENPLTEILYLPSDALAFLNSKTFVGTFLEAAEKVAVHLRNHSKRNPFHSFVIYDTTPFPVAGLSAISLFENAELYVEEESVLMTLEHMGIKAKLSEELEDEIDLLFMWPITKEGTLKDGIMKKILMYRLMMASDGLVFPEKLDLIIDSINSPDLCNMTCVSNTKTCGVKIEEVFNITKTYHQVDVPLDALPHTSVISQPIPVLRLSLVSGDVVPRGNCCERSESSLLLLGGDVTAFFIDCISQRSSLVHALPYWFILGADLPTMCPHSSTVNIPVELSTRDLNSPCNQSLIVLDKYFSAVDGKSFNIKLTWKDGIFIAKLQSINVTGST